ncbi:MAG: PKD domain protein [Methanoregula sp. PtaU1.Bin006]|nr:MAG: PKD domain protein [Methanoregula sp. PtaB.Bin085]OPY37285.1 MAG: PKD domain protein [Methanoregula sp. PtaU1.Bin006]
MFEDPRRKKKNSLFFVSFFLIVFIVYPVTSDSISGTLTPVTISNTSVRHWEPAIFGDYIVWSDDRTGDRNIYLYNIATGSEYQITDGPVGELQPVISGHYLSWVDDRFSSFGNEYDVVLYDLDTGITIRIGNETGDQTNPDIDGDLVVWQDARNGDFTDNIYLYSISGDTVLQVSDSDGSQIMPHVSDNVIVWENGSYWPPMVSVYDYAGNQTIFQPVNFGMDEEQIEPAIDNNHIVWVDTHEGTYLVYMMDLATGDISDITPNLDENYFPDIDGSRIIWKKYENVFLNDTAISESETQVSNTDGSTTKENLRISGDRIVWRDSGSPDMIYLYTIGTEEVCPDADFTIAPSQAGAVPFEVSFNDASVVSPTNPIAHWNWSFGDGNYSSLQNPVWTYDKPGNYDVQLIVDNPLCRNATEIDPAYRITAGAAPIAGISAIPLSGMVPLDVTFTDTSEAATAWNWSFGDGTYAETNPVSHTYSNGGVYTVRLIDENEYGNSTATTTIHALTGANQDFITGIEGFIIVNRFGGQFLVYNGTTLPGYSMPSVSVLTTPELTEYGWQNITFRSNDNSGFRNFGNETIMGNLSGVVFYSDVIHPAGFSPATGADSSIFYMLELPLYPAGGTMNTQVWEGVLDPDLTTFRYIGHSSGFSHVLGVAYTIRNTLTSFTPGGPARLYVSVNSSWVASHEGREHTYLVRIGDDNIGQVLPTQFLYRDPDTNLDYFVADSPRGLSKFGLSQLAGSGNPLQLITLSVTSHVGPPEPYIPVSESDAGMPAGSVSPSITYTPVPTPSPTATQETKVTADPGVSAKVYTNAQGVVSQETRLTSSDGRATITIGEGITARNAAGEPLERITMQVLSTADLPPVPSDPVFVFDGIAYEIGPDGATFSPPVSLSLSPVQPRWGRDYWIKTFDRKSGTWQDLPTTFDGSTGTVMAPASHFSIHALFTSASTPPPTIPETTVPPTVMPQQVKAQPPTTAVSIFMSMMEWIAGFVTQNLVIITAVAALAVAGFFMMRGGKPKWE